MVLCIDPYPVNLLYHLSDLHSTLRRPLSCEFVISSSRANTQFVYSIVQIFVLPMSSVPPPLTTPPSDSNKKDSSDLTSSSSSEGVAMDVMLDAPGEETWEDLPRLLTVKRFLL